MVFPPKIGLFPIQANPNGIENQRMTPQEVAIGTLKRAINGNQMIAPAPKSPICLKLMGIGRLMSWNLYIFLSAFQTLVYVLISIVSPMFWVVLVLLLLSD